MLKSSYVLLLLRMGKMSTELVAAAAEKTAGTALETVAKTFGKHPVVLTFIGVVGLCALGYMGTRKGAEISLFGFKAKGPA